MKPWIVIIGIDKFYLTEEEKKYYLSVVTSGGKYVDLGDKILGSNFQYMAKNTALEETKMLDEGKWMCEKGHWHTKGWQCTCNSKEITKP